MKPLKWKSLTNLLISLENMYRLGILCSEISLKNLAILQYKLCGRMFLSYCLLFIPTQILKFCLINCPWNKVFDDKFLIVYIQNTCIPRFVNIWCKISLFDVSYAKFWLLQDFMFPSYFKPRIQEYCQGKSFNHNQYIWIHCVTFIVPIKYLGVFSKLGELMRSFFIHWNLK